MTTYYKEPLPIFANQSVGPNGSTSHRISKGKTYKAIGETVHWHRQSYLIKQGGDVVMWGKSYFTVLLTNYGKQARAANQQMSNFKDEIVKFTDQLGYKLGTDYQVVHDQFIFFESSISKEDMKKIRKKIQELP